MCYLCPTSSFEPRTDIMPKFTMHIVLLLASLVVLTEGNVRVLRLLRLGRVWPAAIAVILFCSCCCGVYRMCKRRRMRAESIAVNQRNPGRHQVPINLPIAVHHIVVQSSNHDSTNHMKSALITDQGQPIK